MKEKDSLESIVVEYLKVIFGVVRKLEHDEKIGKLSPIIRLIVT